jgi:hypothetical protein
VIAGMVVLAAVGMAISHAYARIPEGLVLDIIGNKREDLSFQRKLESRTKHPFEKLDSCLRRNDKQFISNSRYLGFG